MILTFVRGGDEGVEGAQGRIHFRRCQETGKTGDVLLLRHAVVNALAKQWCGERGLLAVSWLRLLENQNSSLLTPPSTRRLHHEAKVLPEVLSVAVKESKERVHDRFLPDKAVDVLDEASPSTLPPALEKSVDVNS